MIILEKLVYVLICALSNNQQGKYTKIRDFIKHFRLHTEKGKKTFFPLFFFYNIGGGGLAFF